MVSSRKEGDSDATGRVKTEFLVQTQDDRLSSAGVLLLGATNLPWTLDTAMLRRFERRILVPLPDFEGRLTLLKRKLSGSDMTSLTEADLRVRNV